MQEFASTLSLASPDPNHGYLLPTKAVSEGFGVTPETIRSHKRNHSDELSDGLHFLQTHAGILWTKLGIIRLSFFINSDRSMRFRLAVEQQIMEDTLNTVDSALKFSTPDDATTDAKLQLIAESVADEMLAPYMDQLIKQNIARKVQSVPGISEILGKLGYPVPRNLESLLA
jgi:hypothetical protein